MGCTSIYGSRAVQGVHLYSGTWNFPTPVHTHTCCEEAMLSLLVCNLLVQFVGNSRLTFGITYRDYSTPRRLTVTSSATRATSHTRTG